MYAVASVLCKTLQMSFSVDPGVRYFSVGPTISALASKENKFNSKEKKKKTKEKKEKKFCVRMEKR